MKSRPELVLFFLGSILWLLLWLFAHTDRSLAMRGRQIALFFGAFTIFFISLAVMRLIAANASRRLVWFVLLSGIVFRLSLAPFQPITTSDIYRYLWEGRVVRAGFNPYREAPDSPRLEWLRNRVWHMVQFKHVPAAYPPVAQYVFAAATFLPADPIMALKLLLALFDIATLLLLPGLLTKFGRSPGWTIIYAWHPIVLGEVVARGHLDSIGIFFLVASFRLLSEESSASSALGGAALAASVLSKGYAAIAAPFLFLGTSSRWKEVAAGFFITAALLYLPFANAGLDVFRGMTLYAAYWQGNSSIYALLRFLVKSEIIARVLCIAILLCLIGYLLASQARQNESKIALKYSFFSLMAFFLLTPAVFPWYLSWTIPFLCLFPNVAWLALTGSIFGFYAHDFAGHRVEIWWVTMLEYGVPMMVLVGYAVSKQKHYKPLWQEHHTPTPNEIKLKS